MKILLYITVLVAILSLPFSSKAQSPKFTSTPVTNGVLGEYYEYHITTSGWWFYAREIILSDGDLPNGIELHDNGNGTGRLSGTPEETGSFYIELTVRRTDNHNQNDVQSFTLTIAKKKATVTLGNLNAVYDGNPHEVSVTTSPGGLDVEVKYDGNESPPVNAGSYQVMAVIDDDDYYGSATGTLKISKAEAEVNVGTITKKYNGNPHHATASTSPAGLDLEFTYNGSSTAPTNIGNYTVKATVSNQNYTGSGTGTLIIEKGDAQVTLGGLNTTYTGQPQEVTVNTTPSGLAVDVTYDNSSAPPVDAGSYAVKATINDPNYTSSAATGTMVISRADATISLSDLTHTFDGNPKPVTVTTSPEGLYVEITYDGLSTAPSQPGEYTVEAVINEKNYKGHTTGKLTIKGSSGGVNVPVITNLEKESLLYNQGDPGLPITSMLIINDFDDTHMYGATVTIDKNYITGEDLLEYSGSADNITSEFVAEEGMLTLSGVATRSAYETALSQVTYRNTFIGETDIVTKNLKITVSDSLNTSAPAFRGINIYVLPELDMVNTFTPNGDGVNDQWNFVNLEAYSQVKISVFNKHGQMVYGCYDKECQWDGTYRGKLLPADTYFYTIDLDNGKRKYQGAVTILR